MSIDYRRLIVAAFTLAALVLVPVGPSMADPGHAGHEGHDDHQAQHKSLAAHGGVVVESSSHHHYEIVAKDGALDVYVYGEDGKPEDVSGATASASILSGGQKADVALTPGAEGQLSGTGAFKAKSGTVIVITLTMPDHEPEQARLRIE